MSKTTITDKHTNIKQQDTDPYTENIIYNHIKYKREVMKKAIKYQFCPNCESNDIIYNGKIKKTEKQKYKCKACNHSFVASIDSIFRDSLKTEIYTKEFEKKEHTFCDNFYFLLTYLDSRENKKNANRKLLFSFDDLIKDSTDYNTFLYLVMHEACLLAEQMLANKRYLDE